MTAITTQDATRTTRPVTTKAKQVARRGAVAALTRLGRGLKDSPAALIWWLGAHSHDQAIADAGPGDPTTKAQLHQAVVIRDRKAVLVTVVAALAGWATGGWWPLAVLYLAAALALSFLVFRKIRAEWAVHCGRAWLALSVTVAAEWLHLVYGASLLVMDGGLALLAASWLIYAAGDGSISDNLPGVDVRRSDEPRTAPATESNAVLALAKAVGVGVQRDGSIDRGAAAAEVMIIGAPSRRGKWTRTHFQLQTKVFADLERDTKPEPIQKAAGVLRRPSGWVFAERIGDESQGVLYVADENPWPTKPITWRGLDQLEHDAWTPEVIGVDMLTGEPVSVPVAATSDMCGASPGGGKTAWTRLELCRLVADPRVDRVVVDMKGDGALAAFEPACSTYLDGDGVDTMKAFAEWLEWLREVESPRRKAALKKLVKAGLAPDVKLTREIAANPEYGLPLMVVIVDEAQDGCSHKEYGQAICDGLVYAAKQGRSIGIRLKIRTQKPTDDRTGIPSALNSVLPTRIAGRAEDYQVSKATLLTSKLRADLMPDGPDGLFYLRLPGGRTEKVLAEYVDANQAQDYVRRVLAHQRATGHAPAEPAGPPRILLEMRRLLTERGGRMRSEEMAAALIAYGLLEDVTDDDRAGTAKTDVQLRQEKLAAAVAPWSVRTRPDGQDQNRMAYWLTKQHRELGDVGVEQGIARAERGHLSPVSGSGYSGSLEGSATGSRRLRVVG